METWTLPSEPEGPVYDCEGRKWHKTKVNGGSYWTTQNLPAGRIWYQLLFFNGPITSEPPMPDSGTMRWSNIHPNEFVVVGWDGSKKVWMSSRLGATVGQELIDKVYTRTSKLTF